MPDSCLRELKTIGKKALNLLVTDQLQSIGELVSCSQFSSLQKLLRVTAYVLRAVDCFRKRTGQSRPTGCLTSGDIASAELLWIIQVQQDLVKQKKLKALLKPLGLFLDDKGIWRCGGRLQKAEMSYSTKFPIVLPRDHAITNLVVQDAHTRMFHNGVKETLTEVRTKFWVVRAPSLARGIIHKCVISRKHEGMPFLSPPPPPLPTFRVKEDPAFTYTGVDFAGPVFVRSSDGNAKVWICVFTCLVTRAIHLDLVTDLSTDTFLRCVKHFPARRGLPIKFLSDNVKTFKSAAVFLKRMFQDDTVKDYLGAKGCQWTFNVERAPWWGGVFERMVRSTKRCLRKTIGRANLTRDELHTMVVEIEAVINSKPLSYYKIQKN